jgi:hypothetical protein
MTKLRVLIFLLTLMVVGSIGFLIVGYARGYRFDWKNFRFNPKGLLVLKSEPTGAQIFIDGELKTATDATVSISPGTYDVSVRKDGYITWNKRLAIEKEVVTVATVNLFRAAPSLTAVTFDGVLNPVASDDFSRIAFAVTPSLESGSDSKAGLWVIDTTELPLGFSKDPRRITDGDITQASWEFSPDVRQVMLTTKAGAYLLDVGSFTPQAQRVNVASRKESILKDWEEERGKKLSAQIKNLPDEVVDLLGRKASSIAFSPDETRVLYTASSSSTLDNNLIKPLPGSSTQRQERNIEVSKTYVYDIKEDRNFFIADEGATVRWFPTSRHLVQAEEGKVTILEYDGTNRQAVYTGSYSSPYVYPYVNSSKLLILTNLGAGDAPTNLYSLSLK